MAWGSHGDQQHLRSVRCPVAETLECPSNKTYFTVLSDLREENSFCRYSCVLSVLLSLLSLFNVDLLLNVYGLNIHRIFRSLVYPNWENLKRFEVERYKRENEFRNRHLERVLWLILTGKPPII